MKNLSETDIVNGDRYLFLLSGKYIDERKDTQDNRGEFEIPSKQSFVKSGRLFNSEEILLEDIQDEVSSKITSMYPNIKEKKDEHLQNLQGLKDMFLLSDETLKDISISMNDTEASILKKVYEAEAKKEADFDANIKKSLDSLIKLDTTTEEYTQKLEDTVSNLVKTIPIQNKNSLTHYVARRKLILDLFEKIRNKELEVQSNSERNKHEALIHNLIFKQKDLDTEASNLWILNEEFIYFSGGSEIQLKDIEFNGEKIFKAEFEQEEERYLNSLGQRRLTKKPDIFLFPQESKCILLELKAMDVDVSEYLSQIDKYAGLILNFTKDKFNIDTFYGYLLGEEMEANDIRFADGKYLESYHLDYLYRPSQPVAGITLRNGVKRADGSIYSEVLKYSTLLERANMRNKIFIDKLGLNTK